MDHCMFNIKVHCFNIGMYFLLYCYIKFNIVIYYYKLIDTMSYTYYISLYIYILLNRFI